MSPSDNSQYVDASLVPDADFDDALRRVSYQPGMLLGLEATRSEQDFHRRRLTRHGYWLHGSGTVAGLRVSLAADDPGDDMTQVRARLLVSPGIGVDGLGREVTVGEPYWIDLGAWLSTQYSDADAWGALVRDGLDAERNILWLTVTMRYQDVPSGLQPVMATDVNAGTDPVEPSRIKDSVCLELIAELPGVPQIWPHPFAAHNGLPDYASLADKLGPGERALLEGASGQTRRQLELGARLLFALGEDGHALETRQKATITAAELARTMLARIAVQLTEDRQLIVNPNRIDVDNLSRPFLFNAATLARLVRE